MTDRYQIACLLLLLAARSVEGQGAPACPGPAIDTAGWFTVVADSPRVQFKLPPGFVRKHWEVTVGEVPPEQDWHRDLFLNFHIEESPGPDSLDRAGIVRQQSVENYSQCFESINGARALIQAQRGSGTIFDEGKQFKSFDVYATVERRPGTYVKIRAHGATRGEQETLLAIVRSVRLR